MKYEAAPKLVIPVGPEDHSVGSSQAVVTLVEYGDYECPYCGMAFPVVKAVQEAMGADLRFVFRNFPLTQVHPHAQQAAEMAEAAAAQGQFWAMHDLIYTHQDALEINDLMEYAQSLGLDMTRIAQELSSHHWRNRIHQDFLGGIQSGVNGTPTFYINGVRYQGRIDVSDLLASIDVAVQA